MRRCVSIVYALSGARNRRNKRAPSKTDGLKAEGERDFFESANDELLPERMA
jgi:hypothetical protein